MAGYGIALLSWVQLFYICELSQDIEVILTQKKRILIVVFMNCTQKSFDILFMHLQDNGTLEQVILLDFEWYKMPVEFQKDFILLILRKQNGATFTVGPFGVINRELFSDVINFTLLLFKRIKRIIYLQISKKIYTLLMFLMNYNK